MPLSKEELVWLSGYCAALVANGPKYVTPGGAGEELLAAFKKRFPPPAKTLDQSAVRG